MTVGVRAGTVGASSRGPHTGAAGKIAYHALRAHTGGVTAALAKVAKQGSAGVRVGARSGSMAFTALAAANWAFRCHVSGGAAKQTKGGEQARGLESRCARIR